jgi:serine/threonine protein phosphatase PrpC
MLEIDFFHLTDVGCVREENEDAVGFWPYEDGFLFAVADGLGGHNAGQVASSLALEVLLREMSVPSGSLSLVNRLRQAVREANLAIYYKGTTVPELHRMGTTLTASALVGGTLVTAHVGDCRLYLLRNGTFTQLTKDHTHVWEQVQYGILSPKEARTHPNRHVLSRCLGHDLIPAIDILKMDVQAGDLLVQCSDGIYDSLPESEMVELLNKDKPKAACSAIIERAREAGGHDNMSLQVASVISCSPPAVKRAWWRLGR